MYNQIGMMFSSQFKQINFMSHNSLLNIQEISSRTYHNQSMMESSIDHIDRNNTSIIVNMIKPSKRFQSETPEELIRRQRQQFQKFRQRVIQENNHVKNTLNEREIIAHQQSKIHQLIEDLERSKAQNWQLNERYHNSMIDLKETLHKNEILSQQVDRLRQKINKMEEVQLNYSKERGDIEHKYQQSQQFISNLSRVKSSYEIQLVNMKDSLHILEKEKRQIEETNDQYQQKLALLSQQIQRLRGIIDPMRMQISKLKNANNELQQHLKKKQYESLEGHPQLERFKIQIRDLKANNTSLSAKLQEYHQKLLYKERQLNDIQERDYKIQQQLKMKESQIKELQMRTQNLIKSTKNFEQQSIYRDGNIKKELGRAQIALKEMNEAKNKLQIQKEQIIRDHQQFLIKFEILKKDYEMTSQQKQAIIRDIQSINLDKDNLIIQRQHLLKQRERISFQSQVMKDALKQAEAKLKEVNMEKSKQLENTIRHFQQNSKSSLRQYQMKLQNLTEQKNKELTARLNQINQYKIQILNLKNHLQNFKAQLNAKNNEIHHLKQSTISQSTIIDTTRRDCQEKIKEKNDYIHDMEIQLQNLERVIEQHRRQKDQMYHEKNQEYSNFSQKYQNLAKQVKNLQKDNNAKNRDIENYIRIIKQNQDNLHQIQYKMRQKDQRILHITNELERITSILRDKDSIIVEINASHRQLLAAFEQKKSQIQNLREINEKISMNLNKVEESKNNFQLFMVQIERLNQVNLNKESQLKKQRIEIAKLIQKINIIYQQQTKIIQIIQNSYIDEAKRDVELNNQLTDMKEYIGKLNQTTNFTLQDIYQQGGNIINFLTKNQSDLRYKIQDQTSHYQTLLSQKDQQILIIKRQIQQYQTKIKTNEQNSIKQDEIYEKLIELTRENAAIKEQLVYNNNEYEAQIGVKNQSIIQLESKIKQIDRLQKKQLTQLKLYIEQRQKQNNQALQQSLRVKQELQAKDRSIDRLKKENIQLENKLLNLSKSIDIRLLQIQKASQQMSSHNRQIEHYKQIIKKYQLQIQQYQMQQLDQSRLSNYQRQIEKLQKIIEIRNIQISNNEESYFKQKHKLQENEKQLLKYKKILTDIKSSKKSENRFENQIKKLEQENDWHSSKFREISELKQSNLQLQRQLRMLQNKFKESQKNLAVSNQQINKLKLQAEKLLEFNKHSINKLQIFQNSGVDKQQLQQRIHYLEDQLDFITGQFKQLKLDYDFLKQNQNQNNTHLHAYEHKNMELEKQYLQLRDILSNLHNQNSKLNTKNHYFQIQLQKAQILQQKIQVLNSEIHRLSFENINLNEQIASCKLAISGESSIERKTQEQLCLIVMLFAQIQSLRSRLKDSQNQLQNSRSIQLSRFRY